MVFFCSAIGQQRLKTVQKTIVCSQEKKENWSTDNRGFLSLIPRPDRRRPDRRRLDWRRPDRRRPDRRRPDRRRPDRRRPDRRRPDRRSLETRLRCQVLSLVPSGLGYEATQLSHVTEMNTRLSNVYKL